MKSYKKPKAYVVWKQLCRYLCKYVNTYVYIYLYMNACIYVHTWVYMYACIVVCTYKCMYSRIWSFARCLKHSQNGNLKEELNRYILTNIKRKWNLSCVITIVFCLTNTLRLHNLDSCLWMKKMFRDPD